MLRFALCVTLALVVGSGGPGCRGSELLLSVDVRTDLVPGVEYQGVRTERLAQLPGRSTEERVLDRVDALASVGDDFIAGRRVAEMDLGRGDNVLRVRLLDEEGVVLERVAVVTVRASTVATIVMTRDCRGVMCPGSGDLATQIACLGVRCVAPECTPETPASCPSSSCTSASECPSPSADCAEAACVDGVCLALPRGLGCPVGEACIPEIGCVPVPQNSVDAGPSGRDARVDGSRGPADVGLDADGTVDAAEVSVDDGGDSGAGVDAGPPPVAPWVTGFGNTDVDVGYDVAMDATGNAFVVGTYQLVVDPGTGPLPFAGASDIFVACCDPNGISRWSWGFGSMDPDNGFGVAADANGNAFITGAFLRRVDFGTGTLASAGMRDVVVASYDASGGPRWTRRMGGASEDVGTGIATDSDGNVFVTGGFGDVVDFGTGPLTSAGSTDGFVASYDSLGMPRWSRRFGGTGIDVGEAVATDGAGNVA